MNVFVDEKNLSKSRRMRSLPFYIITKCFLSDSKTVPHLDRKRFKVVHKPIKICLGSFFFFGPVRIGFYQTEIAFFAVLVDVDGNDRERVPKKLISFL